MNKWQRHLYGAAVLFSNTITIAIAMAITMAIASTGYPNQSKLSSKAVAAIRYSSTSQLKLQYQIAYTEKGTDTTTLIRLRNLPSYLAFAARNTEGLQWGLS